MSGGSAPSMERCCRRRFVLRLPLIWASSLVVVASVDPSKAALISRQGPKIEFQNSAGVVEFDGGGGGTSTSGQSLLKEGAAQKQAAGKHSGGPRVVFRDHPGTIVFGGGNGEHSGSGGGPSRIVFKDSPKEIVFGGGGSGGDSGHSGYSGSSGSSGSGGSNRAAEAQSSGASSVASDKVDPNQWPVVQPAPPAVGPSNDMSQTTASLDPHLEERLINQDKQLGKRLDQLEHTTNAKVQHLEDDIHKQFGKLKDITSVDDGEEAAQPEITVPNIVDPVSGQTRRPPSRRRRTLKIDGDAQLDERVAGLEEYISEQAREMAIYQKEMETLESSKAEQDTRIMTLEQRLKSVQGDVGSIDLSPQSPAPVVVSQPSSPSAPQANAEETKAELNTQMEAIRNTIATFEVDTRSKMESVEKRLTGQYTSLEARVATNEGKLRGVKENSLGGALR